MRRPMTGQAQEKPKNIKVTLWRLLAYMKGDLFVIGLTIIIAIVGTLIQVFAPKVLGSATTIVFDGIKNMMTSSDSTGIDFFTFSIVLLCVAGLYTGIFIAEFITQRLMIKVAQKTSFILRNELKAKMARVPVAYFDKHPSGELMSVASNDIDNIVTNLQQSLTAIITSTILIIGLPIMMLSISPILTLIAILSLPCTVLVMKLITPLSKRYNAMYYKLLGQLNTQIEESYQGFDVIKTFNSKKASIEKFEKINQEMIKSGWKARFLIGMTMPSAILIQTIVYILIAAVGAVKVISGKIFIGDMQAFIQYSWQFGRPLQQISMVWGNTLSMIASAERVFAMLDEEDMPNFTADFPNKIETDKIRFDHVQFGYSDHLLMKDFNLQVASGEMIAIVGHTGAGKTTLINLLQRFYEINGGSIRIDGQDIRNFSRENLRRRIGMVLQDTWLFSGSIFDNIKYGNEQASDEQVYAAAKAAFVDDFVQTLPEGYATILNEDASNISQGQRQLITIARAFVSKPEILILDEATSNVDSRTEHVIQNAMRRLLKDKTSFVVAHRLSTIYDADRIIVMENGDVVEIGSHTELIAARGSYAEIYNSQFASTMG